MAKILLVDDAEDILFLLEQSFKHSGHAVLSTTDPRRVLPMSRTGRFDAIVLDVMMPEISGWTLLEKLRAQAETRETPVVLLTALSSVEDRVRGLRSGADDYLTKPFEPAELMARIEGLIQRRASTAAALQGQLEEHPVQEVLQQLEQGRKTGRLELTSSSHSARVCLREGRIVLAEHGSLEGEEALLEMLALESGRFRFHPGARHVDDAGLALTVSPLLIRAAWIDDELRKRQHLLPSATTPMALVATTPKVPEDLPRLPIARLIAAFAEADGSRLEDLVTRCRVASNRVYLAVAWLLEEGTIQPLAPSTGTSPHALPIAAAAAPAEDSSAGDPSAADPSAAGSSAEDDGWGPLFPTSGALKIEDRLEDLDIALREFLQAALNRGVPLDAVKLEVLCERSAWLPSMEVLASIPKAFLSMPPLSIGRPFRCTLEHPAGDLAISWAPMPEHGQPTQDSLPAPDAAGLVLWLGSEWSGDQLDRVGSQLVANAPAAAAAILTTDSSLLGSCSPALSQDPRWRIPLNPPMTFDQLLLELAQADPLTMDDLDA